MVASHTHAPPCSDKLEEMEAYIAKLEEAKHDVRLVERMSAGQ